MSDIHDLVASPESYLGHADPAVRRLAISACSGKVSAELAPMMAEMAANDPEPRVRAEATEVLAEVGEAAFEPLLAALTDPAAAVREAAATGLGELAASLAVSALMRVAVEDGESLVREAAVAALGAVGDPAAIPVLLDLITAGPPQVRRRCVVALSVFDGPHIEAAIRAAREDRNPMVREAAEMVIGR